MKMSRLFSSTLLLVAAVVAARPAAAVSAPSEVIATGNGWRLVDVEPATRANSMIWEVTRAGVANLPVSQAQKDILTQAWADLPLALNNDTRPDTLYFSQEMLDAMVTPTWPAGYEQFIEPETETRGLSVCSWSTKTKGGNWSHTSNSLAVDLPFSGSVTGELTANLPLSVQASVTVTYKVRKCLGIPVAWRFEFADASGSATLQGSGDLSLTAHYQDDWEDEWEITTIELGDSTFFIGPIPVRLVYTLPIYAGARFAIDVTGQVSVALDASASGSFNYHCTKSNCSGSSSFTDQFDFHDTTASVSVDIEAEASARVMFRVAVYDDAFLYVEGGAKAYAKADVWGYYGNTCGDADGNGHNETVRALVADVFWGYKFAYGWGGLPNDEVRYTGGSEYWLAWYDLLGTGSTALAPMVIGPGTVGEGEDGAYAVRMRPCYPYTELVTLAMAPGVWNGTTTVTPPSGATTLSHTFPTSGTTTITATAVSDSRGRQLAASYGRPITVAVGLPAAPSYLTATALSASSVRLNWTDNSHNEAQFEIQRRPTQVGAFQQVGLVGANVTTFTDNTVAAGTTYDYRVRAVNTAGTSNPSGVAVVTTPALPAPAAPSNLVASYNPATQRITATWVDNANNETGFTLEFSYSGSAWSPVLGTLGVNANSWQSGSGVPLGSYQFRVRANNANGSSAWSNVASLLAIP